MKSHCAQNDGDCSSCSLVSYGKDCNNEPIWGGKRPGAGRKPSGRKAKSFYITNEENKKLREYLNKLREE